MNTSTRMRDAGRTWSDIVRVTGLPLALLRAQVEEDKRERRESLAHSPRNEDARGLNDLCHSMIDLRLCNHPRRDHVNGECTGCREYVIERDAMWGRANRDVCTEFTDKS